MTAPDAVRAATNVTVLIAAHNEATVIAPTIRSLQAQSRAPDRIVVVADRCADGTEPGQSPWLPVPGLHAKHGECYRAGAWTEDWMITFAVKHDGRKILKPQDCKIITTPAPTWRQMFRQRQRWSQGYVETICRFGRIHAAGPHRPQRGACSRDIRSACSTHSTSRSRPRRSAPSRTAGPER